MISEGVYDYYLDQAQHECKYSNCLRRQFGAVLVSCDDVVISSGNNSSPIGIKSCKDLGECIREKLKVPHGTQYEMCRSVHAEQSCIIKGHPDDMEGATLFLVGIENNKLLDKVEPCIMCKRSIINARIKNVVVRNPDYSYTTINVSDWITNDLTIHGKDSYTMNHN